MRQAGFSQRQVARRLGINRKTVKRYWEMPVNEYEEMSSAICRMQYLDKYQAQIIGWLREYPDLTAAQVWDWLKEHYREEVSERTVSRYVKQLREEYGLKKSEAPRAYEAVPELPMGQQMQVDFGQKLMPNVDGGQTKVYVAAFLLSRSRYKYAQMQSWPFTSVDLVRICHDCFQYMGGMPAELVFDQDSIVCVSENTGDIIYTYEFEKFRQECKLSIRMCRGADPESKGKIENTVKYIKGNFLSNRLYVDDGILNGSCLDWLERTANAKVHGTTKLVPAKVFQEEREYLRPLPVCDQVKRPVICRTVRKDNTIIYDSASPQAPYPSLSPVARAHSFRCGSFPHATRFAGFARGPHYSVPLGTYTTQPEVRIETLDGTLYIRTLFGEPICEHRIASPQAPYPSLLPAARARSFRCGSFPHTTRFAGLAWGPRQAWVVDPEPEPPKGPYLKAG